MSSTTPPSSLDRWYALAVVSGRERSIRTKILDRLERAGLTSADLELICPDEEVVVNRGTAERTVERRLTLPGYMLLRCRRLSPERVVNIKRVSGVMSFLGGDDTPQPLARTEIEGLLGKPGAPTKRRTMGPAWEVGGQVVITSGPLTDFAGEVTAVNDAKETVTVDVEIFGRRTPAQVPFRDLRRA